MINNQTDFEYFSEFYSFWKRWDIEGNSWRSDIKKGELNCENHLVRCARVRFKPIWMRKKSDFCRVKSAILYHFSHSKNVFLRRKRGVCRLTFYGSGWSLTQTPFRCWQKIIFVLDFKLCIRSSISQNCTCKSILSCSKS